MKTTLDLADNILARAKAYARREGLTLRSLVEEGLELVLKKRENTEGYRYKPVTFKGKGLVGE